MNGSERFLIREKFMYTSTAGNFLFEFSAKKFITHNQKLKNWISSDRAHVIWGFLDRGSGIYHIWGFFCTGLEKFSDLQIVFPGIGFFQIEKFLSLGMPSRIFQDVRISIPWIATLIREFLAPNFRLFRFENSHPAN